MQMIMNPKAQTPTKEVSTPKKEESTEKEKKDEEIKTEKSVEEILEERNKVDPFRVKMRKTVDYIKLKYF